MKVYSTKNISPYELLKMPGEVAICLLKANVERPAPIWSTTLEFVFLSVVVLLGLILNYGFLKKLKKEKRNRPLGRKGNVIEPIVCVFCIIQMIYWPYNILFMWIVTNEVIPIDYMYGHHWLFSILYQIGIKMGRMYIAWNSIFVALIRYLYIVHQERSNQWKFEKVGMLFCISSLVIPIVVQSIGSFTSDWAELQLMFPQKQLAECIASHLNVNSTTINIPYTPDLLNWTMTILPESLIKILWLFYISTTCLVFSNMVEFMLYLKVFLTIKRYEVYIMNIV